MIGAALAHFRLVALLGEGGMGAVYRAEDTKLGREVAIKVLPEDFADDPERLARFEREARVLASLDHPGIAALYEVGRDEIPGREAAVHYLVMQLAAGEDLAERLSRGPLPVTEALALALQLAEALEAAHERGIVHRDLKPANLKVTADGQLKILDFGLAKAWAPEPESARALSLSPTLTANATQAGVLLGTAAYMSPEQARGRAVDKRADIWAFGVILYEMLSGERGFHAETLQDTLAAVLTSAIDLDRLPAATPASVRRLIARCLEKDPTLRLRDIGEARIVLQRGEEPAAAEAAPRARTGAWRITAGAAALALAALGGWLAARSPASDPAPLRKLEIDVGSFDAGWEAYPRISPDGSRLVYWKRGRLWLRELDRLAPVEVPSSFNAAYPCWSPDSRYLAYAADWQLWKLEVDGGTRVPLGAFPRDFTGSGGMVWLPDGRIVAAGGSTGLVAISDRGGHFETLLPLDPQAERDIHELELLPDGETLLYVLHRDDGQEGSRLVDTIEAFRDGARRRLLTLEGEALQSVAWSPSGHLLFHRGGANPGLWAVRFDPERLEVVGQPFQVAPEARLPSVARDGTLLMVQGLSRPLRELARVDRRGAVLWSSSDRLHEMEAPAISPDGTRVAVDAFEQNNWDVYVFDVATGTRRRLTFSPAFDSMSAWSPDGRQLAVTISDRQQLSLVPASGGEQKVFGRGFFPHWSPDGEWIVYSDFIAERATSDIFRSRPDGSDVETLVTSQADAQEPRLSPDGSLLAYASNESGRFEVYLRSYPAGDAKWQVSSSGGQFPRWSAAGELFFTDNEQLYAVPVRTGESVTVGAPQPLFSPPDLGLMMGVLGFDVSADGKSFYMERNVDDPESRSRLVLVENWFAEFAERDAGR